MGDFNVSADPKIDRYNSIRNHITAQNPDKRRSRESILNLMEEYYLCDIWRDRNPEKMYFSWTKRSPGLSASRIDYALVSKNIGSFIPNITYVPAFNTDHSACFISLDFVQKDRGPGYWKLNCNLLHDPVFVEKVNNKIDQLKQRTEHPFTVWEELKSEVQKIAKKTGKKAKREKQLIISQLLEKVEEMESHLPLNEHDDKILVKTKADLNQLVDENTKGIIFRSKIRWQEFGERSSKYFFNLEKARYNSKTCQVIIDSEGTEHTNDIDILRAEYDHYRQLYSKDTDCNFNMQNDYNVRVSDDIKMQQGQEISSDELLSAIKGMKKGRTPGNDGLPIEFYKMFAGRILPLLMNIYDSASAEHDMPPSSMTGILNLIPKPGKDARLIKNLRPITLLNTDYKIIEKVIANRMESAMSDIIHHDQKGFLKNRRISSNIRKIFDLMQYCNNTDTAGFILSMDFKSCFDLISFDAILSSLRFFGFSEWIVDWTETLYSSYSIRIQNNGKFSEKIPIERSVHQGEVNSVYLFLCVAEVLALSLRNHDDIKGIPVNEILNLLNQYADDMDVSSLADQTSLNMIIHTIEAFKYHTGFTINYDKTKLYRIGSLKKGDACLISQRQIAWTEEPLNIFGVMVTDDDDVNCKLNYEPLLEKTQKILNSWKHRDLSLLGKVLVVNTLVASQFVYKMTVLPRIPENIVKRVENIIIKYLWNGRKAKIPLEVLQRCGTQGGIKLVDLRLRDAAIKISWVQILASDDKAANLAYYFINNDLKQWVLDCNLHEKDTGILGIKNTFWQHFMEDWCKLNFNPNVDSDMIIWLNSLIKIENKPFFWKDKFAKGLWKISQLYENGQLISASKAYTDFGLNFLEFNSIICAIPKRAREFVKHNTAPAVSLYAKLLDQKDVCKHVYQELFKQKDNTKVANIVKRWNRNEETQITLDSLYKATSNIFKVTNLPKLRSFQYRLCMKAIVTNKHLKMWKIFDIDSCCFCNDSVETIEHLLFYCDCVKTLWDTALSFIFERTGFAVSLSVKKCIFNELHEHANHLANFICLVTKQYIYRQRCAKGPLNKHDLLREILKHENLEKYVAVKHNKLSLHQKKWYPR